MEHHHLGLVGARARALRPCFLFVSVALASGCSGGISLPAAGGGSPNAGGAGDQGSGGGDAAGGATSGGAGTSGASSGGGTGMGGVAAIGGTSTVGGASSGGRAETGGTSSGGGSGGALAVGGSSSGGAASGGGPGEGFRPCPEAGPCKILPLGDSITFGLGFDGGYRVHLFELALEDGHDITFTGTQPQNGPSMVQGVPFPRKHEGISGQTISQIQGRVPSPSLTEMPHIILVHAGTNDMYQMPNGSDDRLGALMDELIQDAPDALLVFSSIIPFNAASNEVNNLNSRIPELVAERSSQGAHILFVDQFASFPTSELGDGVHPNQDGYNRMAAKWYDAIKSYLP
jgi:GDSL-like Lipase/Acylhydrolase family